MPSEHRLHPYSVIFAFLTQIRLFIVPGILVFVGASSRGGDWWQPWMMIFIIPNAAVALLRYVSYRYRFEPNEMVIRSGLVFRQERHIPYARIQNIDAVQQLLHRVLNVVEVRLETGSGQTAEATMSVLPMEALQQMRERVFAGRHAASASIETAEPSPQAPLLELGPRELMLSGFIENRGGVVIAAAFGLLWELGLVDRLIGRGAEADQFGRGFVRDLVRTFQGTMTMAMSRLALAFAAVTGLLVLVRVLSMGWAVVRLYGFRLTLQGDDLRSDYGLLTRVAATIPLHRIQTLTVRERLLHRLFGRVAVNVDTAGGRVNQGETSSDREWLAPILRREALPEFIRQVLGAMHLDRVEWHPVAAGAFRREIKGWLVMAAIVMGGLAMVAGWWGALAAPLLLVWAVVGARKTVEHLGWAVTEDAVLFRRGWISRRVVIVRFAKIQTVMLGENPFDRRWAMARVRVDAAGASESSRIDIPYLPRETAHRLRNELARHAAGTEFKW
jgi:putative membrane protein